METEQEYLDSIYKATGLKVGKDYGFVFGLHAPYEGHSYQSSTYEPGYVVWRHVERDNEIVGEQLHIYPEDENPKQKVIDFLNSK